MAIEIERKFLLSDDGWKMGAQGVFYRQGYLCLDPARTVRVRLVGDRGELTVKGPSKGPGRTEFECTVPVEEARQMLEELCLTPQIEKVRSRIEHAGLIWEEVLLLNLRR